MSEHEKIDLDIYQYIVETIAASSDMENMSQQVVQLLISGMGVKGATFFILNPVLGELEIVAAEGLSVDYINKGPILVDKSIQLPSNRETVIISDTEKSQQLQYPEKAEKEGIRAIVSIPVNLKGKIIGALRLYNETVWEVTPYEKQLLECLALHMGMALKYFRLATAMGTVKETLEEVHSVWL